MPDYIDSGQILSNAARGAADFATAVPNAKLDLQAKQMQMDDYKAAKQQEASEKADLAKLATDPYGDITTRDGMGKMMKHIAETVKVYEKNGDGIKAAKAREDLTSLYNRFSENEKRQQEEMTNKMDQAGAIFGGVKTEEDLAQAKELLKKIYPDQAQLYDGLNMQQAQLIAKQSKKYMEEQRVQAAAQKEADADRYRKDEEERKRAKDAEEARHHRQEEDHQRREESIQQQRTRIAAAKEKRATNEGMKELKFQRAEVQRNITNTERQIADTERELKNYTDPNYEKNLPREERKARIQNLEDEKATFKNELNEYRTMLRETLPDALPKMGGSGQAKPASTMSDADQMALIAKVLRGK